MIKKGKESFIDKLTTGWSNYKIQKYIDISFILLLKIYFCFPNE